MTQQTGRHRRTARLRTDPRLNLQPAGGERISVSMEDSSRATDWYGRGAMGILGLGYTGAAPMQPVTGLGVNREAIFSKKGIRRNYGRLAVALLCLMLACVLGAQLMTMIEAQTVVDGRDESDGAVTKRCGNAHLRLRLFLGGGHPIEGPLGRHD